MTRQQESWCTGSKNLLPYNEAFDAQLLPPTVDLPTTLRSQIHPKCSDDSIPHRDVEKLRVEDESLSS
jgi:hypothetical protein